ncbi:MAG: hypothetical protein A3F11_05660 [Gammaproteobacteria bacterium RIFCSPHIGHO2_12_FULL_37_14]|nr:MAG: hypothetical protein A3F11_05660 [Gammaproteobacteria bacterium RIFCSPHIGHO2_12_FULL_37_14]
MKLAINAFNIQIGGGVTHLVELLSAADPYRYGFTEVAIWSNEKTLALLPDRPWLKKISIKALNKKLWHKLWWNFRYFSKEVKQYDISYVPGGTYLGRHSPFVNFFQNALPFEPKEKRRFLLTSPAYYIKLNLLRLTQGLTFKKATAVIFPSHYLESLVFQNIRHTNCRFSRVIPHGINPIFFNKPMDENQLLAHKKEIRLIYVSRVDFYKHQWHVVEAAGLLRKMNIPVQLDLTGYVGSKKALKKLKHSMNRVDPTGEFIRYHGHLPYTDLPKWYKEIDIFIFASSCESISSILLEAMASGLAIACSNISVTHEILKDAGIYFDPENPEDIKNAVHQLINDTKLRDSCRKKAYLHAQQYRWNHCADQTFSFLSDIAKLQ